ncbi:type VI secretion system tip protein VgrG [Pseudomonas sp. NA-150]|uniref:type VI secretion system tip protein VgrG n=1 Tax=Pseudomonas sp. NA-150 TaxID=3367525 RepID=UPI0037C60F70
MFDPVREPVFRLDIQNLSHTLNVLSFTGTEAISQPFAFELEVVSESSDLNLQSLMYRSAWLSFAGEKTGINGLIHGAGHSRRGPNLAHYRLSLGPRLACLAQRFNQRIFQFMSAPQIIARVLKEHGIRGDAHRFELSGTYPERMYCAQHHESDLQFVQRLCEEEGIHYHFQHLKRRHVLVFGDTQAGFRRGPSGHFQSASTEAGVSQFRVGQASTEANDTRAWQRAEGKSAMPTLTAGLLLPLSGHPQQEWNHLWLLTEVQHRGDQTHLFEELAMSSDISDSPYRNHFRATPWEVGFRPPPPPVRPPMLGVQRARVVGPVFDQVYCDALGRISVQFDWGCQGQGAHYASCWVPLCPALADDQDPDSRPRVGMDVVVSFVRGDPDQPLVTGCLHTPDARLADSAVNTETVTDTEQDDGPAPREGALRMRLDPRTFVSEGQKIEVSGGINLTFEEDSELLFSVGDTSVYLGAEGLKLCGEQITFNALPERVGPGAEVERQHRVEQLLQLLQANHPLILLCHQAAGNSFAHCQKTPCACRAMGGRPDER